MTTQVWLPKVGRFVRCMHRDVMRAGFRLPKARAAAVWPTVSLPINNYGTLVYPMDGNDTEGDCFEAAIAKGDGTFTGLNGVESTFDTTALVNQYLQYSGGDNGLSEQQAVAIWKAGIGGNPLAVIDDALDFDPTNVTQMRAAIKKSLAVCFTLSLPNSWYQNFDPAGGTVWDGPAIPNPALGHAILINGVDVNGRYHFESWGSWGWITPAGVNACDPDAFMAFSRRQFNPATGFDPYGESYTTKATFWVSVGGNTPPQNPFPTPAPPPVPVPPTPVEPPTTTPAAQAAGAALAADAAAFPSLAPRVAQIEFVINDLCIDRDNKAAQLAAAGLG